MLRKELMNITEKELKQMLSEAYESGWCGIRELNESVVNGIISKHVKFINYGVSMIGTNINSRSNLITNFMNTYSSTSMVSQSYFGDPRTSNSWTST